MINARKTKKYFLSISFLIANIKYLLEQMHYSSRFHFLMFSITIEVDQSRTYKRNEFQYY